MKTLYLLYAITVAAPAVAAKIEPLPPKAPPRVPDALEMLSPGAVHIDGWIGKRIDANVNQRLLPIDTEPLLAGFRHKPGSHPWIGEHVGKWMHAATLAWAYTGDPRLRAKLDRVAAELVRCQEPDGYLGTYVPDKRFGLYPGSDWDVWSHKYNLIGLLTYYQYTGDAAALRACRKMGDLLIATFPAKRSILAAGTHCGMAATSVLEPIVLLYRATGDNRYLDFARYIVRSWDEPGGPKILATLLREKRVDKTANGKAYEMLSNLVGLCELYRATGDEQLLRAVRNAWQDIVDNRLYITGSASAGEHFRGDHELPNGAEANICETCVTVTWMQLNLQLLRLTGEAKYGDEFERSLYNHLAAAQHPRGDDWCYYTPLEGRKRCDKQITCCHSSGPRGMALAPQAAYFRGHDRDGDTVFINTLAKSQAAMELGGKRVAIEQSDELPGGGRSFVAKFAVHVANEATFGVKIRLPEWAVPAEVTAGGMRTRADKAGWVSLPVQSWREGDQILVHIPLGLRLIAGDHGDSGQAALGLGPFVLAFEQWDRRLPAAKTLALPEPLYLYVRPTLRRYIEFSNPFAAGESAPQGVFLPFADAGADGRAYLVWLRDATAAATGSYRPKIDDEGWEVLFDGTNLDAWHVADRQQYWAINAQGELHPVKKGPDLCTKRRYCDFAIELDFKMGPKAKANSGVFLRVHNEANPVHTGMEIQILDDKDYNVAFNAKNACGALYGRVVPTADANRPVGQWNHYRLTANGPTITVEMNGEKIVDADLRRWTVAGKNPDGSHNDFPYAMGKLPREGFIALQNYDATPVWFRNIRIKPLSDRRPQYTGKEPIEKVLSK